MDPTSGELTTRDGLKLATRLWTATNSRAVVVLTHGYGEHSGRYAKLGETLTAAGFALFAYDLRGHGQSQGKRGHAPTYGHFLDDLTQVIDHARAQVRAPHTFIFGHSMGGGIVLNYALTRANEIAGEKLAGVIATGPWLRLAFQPPAWKVGIAKVLAGVVPTLSLPTNLDRRLLCRDAAVVAAYEADPLVHGMMSAAAFTGIVAAGEYTLGSAAALQLPALVMHGGADGITDAKASEAFVNAAGTSDKAFKLWPGMYHEILNELDAQPIYTTINEWLAQRSR